MAGRLLAIANALDGADRKAAAEAAGMDRQTLRDWVIRYNEHGIDGLLDRWGSGRPPRLEPDEQAELYTIVMAGPDPEVDGICAFTREDLVRICEKRFGKTMHCATMGRLLRSMGLSRQKGRVPDTRKKTRPRRRPLKRAPQLLKQLQHTHKDKRLRLFFLDEARIGQKGRVCRVWWKHGERPPGLCDRRFTFAYIFAAVEPGTDNAFALVLPYANTAAMQEFLDQFAATIGEDEHVVLILDQAGWHGSGDLRVPDNVSLVALPPYSPELNPVEWV